MKKLHKDNPHGDLLKKLTIDCAHCSGLCCIALYFAKTEGFPADKPSGKPCQNLRPDFRCAIHTKLIPSNMKGCLAYDCFGAGQKVTQDIYQGKNWQTAPEIAKQMFAVFLIVFQLHQMLWYLVEAATINSEEGSASDIEALIFENAKMTQLSPDEILALDIEKYRSKVNEILKEISARFAGKQADQRRTTDYIGKNFKRANLDGQDFHMALLIASNLEGCSLRGANFLGADLRDTNIKNTDVSKSVFLTQMQVNAATGNHSTKLPANLVHPTAWQK